MIVKLYKENPDYNRIYKVVDVLKNGGVIVVPTDSVYGFACDIYNQKAVGRIAKLKGIKTEKANFSFICYDLSHLSDFTRQVDNNIFKLMKKNLPGPFTFILKAGNNVPKIFHNRKKTIGIRIPDNQITLEIVRELGNPLLISSVHHKDEILDYITDPELIHDEYSGLVDLVVDGGFGSNEPSTVIDCTDDEPVIIREGLGELRDY